MVGLKLMISSNHKLTAIMDSMKVIYIRRGNFPDGMRALFEEFYIKSQTRRGGGIT